MLRSKKAVLESKALNIGDRMLYYYYHDAVNEVNAGPDNYGWRWKYAHSGRW